MDYINNAITIACRKESPPHVTMTVPTRESHLLMGRSGHLQQGASLGRSAKPPLNMPRPPSITILSFFVLQGRWPFSWPAHAYHFESVLLYL